MSYAPPEQERETEQVIGVVTGLVHKGQDKFQAVVQPDGSQYTKNLWTKDEQLVSYLSSQIGNRLAFACNVSNWNLQDGTPVRSLWIDQVGPPALGSPAMAGPSAPQQPWERAQAAQQGANVTVQPQPGVIQAPQEPSRYQQEKEAERPYIHRQSAAKIAAILLGYLPESERTLSTLFVVSERLVAYFNEGLPAPETLDQLINRAMPNSVDPAQGTGYDNQPPLPSDNDIPF
jgi:hypothetical protein